MVVRHAVAVVVAVRYVVAVVVAVRHAVAVVVAVRHAVAVVVVVRHAVAVVVVVRHAVVGDFSVGRNVSAAAVSKKMLVAHKLRRQMFSKDVHSALTAWGQRHFHFELLQVRVKGQGQTFERRRHRDDLSVVHNTAVYQCRGRQKRHYV